MDNPVVIAAFLTLAVFLVFYIVLIPRNGREYTQGDYEDSKGIVKIANVIGNEVYSILPSSSRPKSRQTGRDRLSRVEVLFQRSANPWKLKPHDFTFFKIVFAFLGAILGTVAGFAVGYVIDFIPWFVVTLGGAFLGWIYPTTTYTSAAKSRDLEFKRQLPEALDLIIISLTGGATFITAIRQSLENMQPGILRDEFREIVKTVDSGATLSQALDNFATRAPNDSITTFVKAVQEATELNVPINEVLKSRADASRKDFFALIHAKTATLSSRMMMALTPTLIPAILICVLAPAAFTLLNSL
jgi:tight adherence protein C